jgi:vanillate monooxygenase
MFATDQWYAAAWADEIKAEPLARKLLGQNLVLFRGASGGVGAIRDVCPHRCVPLSLGRVIGDAIECPYHGLRFNASGSCEMAPGQNIVPKAARVVSYPVVERWGLVWVWIGDPEKCTSDAITDFRWLSDPTWVAAPGYFHLRAGYELLLDNLHNHTHLQYVHRRTIGTDDIISASQEVSRRGDRVDVTRWLLNQKPPQLFAAAGGFDGNVDRWFNSTFTSPSSVILDIGCAAAGSGAPQGDRSRGIEIRSLHTVTPETETSCHYFWAYVRNFRIEDPKLTEMLAAGARATFEEDLTILEAQQRNMLETGATPAVHLAADAPGLQVKRILAELARGIETRPQATEPLESRP